jgi:hypothetical protein
MSMLQPHFGNYTSVDKYLKVCVKESSTSTPNHDHDHVPVSYNTVIRNNPLDFGQQPRPFEFRSHAVLCRSRAHLQRSRGIECDAVPITNPQAGGNVAPSGGTEKKPFVSGLGNMEAPQQAVLVGPTFWSCWRTARRQPKVDFCMPAKFCPLFVSDFRTKLPAGFQLFAVPFWWCLPKGRIIRKSTVFAWRRARKELRGVGPNRPSLALHRFIAGFHGLFVWTRLFFGHMLGCFLPSSKDGHVDSLIASSRPLHIPVILFLEQEPLLRPSNVMLCSHAVLVVHNNQA